MNGQEDELIKVSIEGESAAPESRSPEPAASDTSRAEINEAWRHANEAKLGHVVALRDARSIEADAAVAEYERAFEEGNVRAMGAAQRKMTRAEVDLARLDGDHEALKARTAQPADPVEAFIAAKTAPSQRWLREHRDLVEDPHKFARVNAAHFSAVAEGLRPDTDEYFSHLNRHIGLQDSSKRNGGGVRHLSSTESSRVNPHDPNTHDLGSGGVFLTKGERAAATDGTICWQYGPKKNSPIGLEEYARRKREMIRQGSYRKLDQ
jgi:hypothetical protein